MRITIKKMEVMVPSGNQQLQAMQTAKTFERELERIAERANNSKPVKGVDLGWTAKRTTPK